MASQREKREQRVKKYADTDRRMNEHRSSSSLALNVPRGVGFFETKNVGDYKIDIVPYAVGKASKKFCTHLNHAEVGDLYWERTYWCHYQIGPNKSAVVCPAKTCGKPCPVCEEYYKVRDDPRVPKEAADRLKAKERQLFLVYDRKNASKGLQLWEVAYFNFGAQLDQKIKAADTEKEKKVRKNFFYDDENGRTLKLDCTEENSGKSKYKFFVVDEFQKRSEPLPEEIVNHDVCLDDAVNVMAYGELRDLFLESGGEEKAEDEDEPKVAGKGPKAKTDDDEEDDDDDAEDVEDEESETEFEVGDEVSFEYRGKRLTGEILSISIKKGLAQVQVKGRPNANAVAISDLEKTQDADDDEPEDDEEEEEKPKVARGGKKKPDPDEDDEDDDDAFDDDDEPDEDEEDEEEDDEKPPANKGKKK